MLLSATSSGRKDSGRGDQQHDEGQNLSSPFHARQELKVADHKIFVAGQVVAQQLQDNVIHRLRMEDALDHGQQQHNEREERQDGVGSDREGVGVDLGLHQVAQGRPAVPPQPMRKAVSLWQITK
jgi:hypothetical protein